MIKLLYIMLAFIGMAITSCDGHHPEPDMGMKVGDVLCTDGQILPMGDWEKSGKEGIGIVFHVNTNPDVEGKGYAVYLRDLHPVAFADSLGVKQGTSADAYALDGNSNTYALMSQRNVGSPMADAVFELWHYGQSAYIPSVAQLRLLKECRETVNNNLGAIGGESMADSVDGCWYWSSTEVAGQETAKGWLYSLSQGAMQETPKTQEHKVRPIITIND
ncbi:DUF1566 domain-containing protein [Duncaniella freteri]|jgi:hypothetical protein|uniref:DUF1566 domain-containing protein n=1 Tax=Duncaniella freteri TaxID=2530391 RepID=UPI000F4803B5|nr:DUF1566 domain-containing protein [Duncaniella freteri]ROS87194.1 DUF1566 domain-containing protein [Muribaculaceae bacterium Isolate-080 (Janvier)]